VFALAWFRDRPDIRRLGQRPGSPRPPRTGTLTEVIEVPAARAPSLHEALQKAAELGLPYLILDGTIVATDRCAEKKISRKGRQIDCWYSGKAHHPGGNVQALSAPGGVPLWVSDVLPGSTHDLTAAREQVLPQARPYLKDQRVRGHQPAGEPVQPEQLAAGRGVDLLTGHQRHHIIGVHLAERHPADQPALPEHGYPVGQPEHLADVVAREHDRRALLAQPHDQLLDQGGHPDAERGGGLIEQQQWRGSPSPPWPPSPAGAARPTRT
jgi:DDE superfamily endonuclease